MLTDDRLRSHEAYGIGMSRARKHLPCRSRFHHAAGVHDHDIVRHFRDDTEVMGNQHDGRIDLVLQAAEQVQNLCLNRHVQCGGRLVGDDQLRRTSQCHCDHDTLPHTAGEFVRVHVVDTLTVCDTDHLEKLNGASLDRFLGRVLSLFVEHGHLVHLVADAEDRI